MGIFKRLKNITTSGAHNLLDQLENPIQSINQSLRDLEQEMEKAQQALAHQVFLEKKQTALIQETEATTTKRERQAKLAVGQGEDNIAKIALQEKLLQEKKLSLYKEQFDTIHNQTTTLQEKIQQLRNTYDAWRHKRLLLVSRYNVAQTSKDITYTLGTVSTQAIAKDFARAEDRILLLEAELEAGNRISNPLSSGSVVFLDESLRVDVEQELEKLKQTKE